MKKFSILLLLFIILSLNNLTQANFDLKGSSAILVAADTGQVLFEKNPHQLVEPASITKIMSMLLIHEAIERGELSYDDIVTVSRYAQSMYGSQIFLTAGDRVSVWDLQLAVAISSANDATVALAEYLSGSEQGFVNLMNQRAQELGMENTVFSNSTGLPVEHGEHITTAYDIALMSLEFVKHQALLDKTKIWLEYIDLPGRQAMLVNFNRMVRDYPGVDGIKTGHTSTAGYCISVSATNNNDRYIAVIMNTASEQERQEEATRFLDFAFRSFQSQEMLSANQKATTIDLLSARNRDVEVFAKESLTPYVQRGQPQQARIETELFEVEAPLLAGDVVGIARAYQGERFLAQTDLIVTEEVRKASFITILWRRFTRFISNLLSP